MKQAVIAVDIGGTLIRAARLDFDLHIEARDEIPTLADEGFAATLERIKTCIRRVWPDDHRRVAGIGISMPGPLNPVTGVVISPPNLTGWLNIPLVELMTTTFDVPTYIAKDTNAAILAEALRGAARGFSHIVYITISTGLGGAVIADGRLLVGTRGMATEVGHMMIIEDGQPIYLEQRTAGPAIERLAYQRLEKGEQSSLIDVVGGDLSRLKTRYITRAATAGDALALEVVQDTGRLIGMGIVNLLHLFNPEIIVIGGGVSKAGAVLFDAIMKGVHDYCLDDLYWQDLRIEAAALGDDVGLIGAGILVIAEGDTADIDSLQARWVE